jgi:K+-sensing histidine kinase KdpD
MRPRRRPIAHYLVAVAITGAALALRVVLEPLWGTAAPYVLLFPAVLLSAWIGGFGPGALATVGAAVGVTYFWVEP